MHQQGGVDLLGWRGLQQIQLGIDLIEQRIEMARAAHHDTHLVFDINRACKRTQVEPDHRFFQPAAGVGEHLFVVEFHASNALREDQARLLKRARLGLAPSSPKRLFLSASYSW